MAPRPRSDTGGLAPSVVVEHEGNCLPDHEPWAGKAKRWPLATVANAMNFDDHGMIDDWNISASRVAPRPAERGLLEGP